MAEKKAWKIGIQKFEYDENENSFFDEIKSIFQNYLRDRKKKSGRPSFKCWLNIGFTFLP